MSCCKSEVPGFKFLIDDGLDDSFLPTRSSREAAGWDVRAAKDVTIYEGEYVLVPLGIKCFAPEGWWLELRPRSSTFMKKNIDTLYGVIDNDYEGSIYLGCRYTFSKTYTHLSISDYFRPDRVGAVSIKKGDRIGQLIPYRINQMSVSKVSPEEFEKLCKERGSERDPAGFGSSGDK